MQVAHGVQTDVAETLNDDGLALPAGLKTDHLHVIRFIDEVLDAVEDTPSGGWDATVDTTLVDRFAGYARVAVDVLVADSFCVGVGQPWHLTFAGSHVGGGHIDAGSWTTKLTGHSGFNSMLKNVGAR